MQRFSHIISGVLFVAAVAGIIIPAFFPDMYMRVFMLWLCAITAILSAYSFTMMLLFARTPLTAVKTIIRIDVSENMQRASFRRTQIIRANRPDVTAYYTASKPSSNSGKIRNVQTTIFSHGANLQNDLELFGDERAGYEIIQSFGRKLRYRWFMPLIPTIFLKREDISDYMPFIKKISQGERKVMTTSMNLIA